MEIVYTGGGDDETRFCIFHPAIATVPSGCQAGLASGSVCPATGHLRTMDVKETLGSMLVRVGGLGRYTLGDKQGGE